MTATLFRFQRRVAELLLGGSSVILQAPTGAGKTLAAMLPFLDALEQGRDFPHKCLYATPMRVLANQFVEDYEERVKRAGRDDRIEVAIQTGARSDDRQLAATLTFATIDQVLSSYLMCPYSLPRRLGNLNAGAVAASYLVFDEFHLFDPISTLPTTLEMLRMLSGIAPFLLMTATFSRDMLAGLATALDAVVVPEDEAMRQDLAALPSQNKTRCYHAASEPLTADAVLAEHKSRSLVVCNVVDRARALFEELLRHPRRGDTNILLLHSRFLPEDRQRIEGQIREVFGKDGARNGSWILVATQVVEVGLDITCEALHTELGPANAVLQRAGRCARYEGETGDVYIYPESLDAAGETVTLTDQIMPYAGQKDEIVRTLDQFRAHDGEVLTFLGEQEIISAVHGPRDSAIVQGLVATREMHRTQMNQVMSGQIAGGAGNLVRAISSKLVVVHDEPTLLLERPFAAETFGLHPGTVFGLVDKWLIQENELDLEDWGVCILRDLGDQAQSGQSAYKWVPITEDNKGEVAGAALVLVRPELAGYDPQLGFVPDRGTGYRARLAPLGAERTQGQYPYMLEAYVDHVGLVHKAFQQRIWPELASAAARLELTFGWPEGVVERAAHLAVLLHDVGKLNRRWQNWVVRYQRSIGRPVTEGLYAHTDYSPSDPLHEQVQKDMPPRPSHAVEGAVSVAPLLATAAEGCEPVFAGAFTAISRHHGAFTHQYQHYELVSDAAEAVTRTLSLVPEHVTAIPGARQLVRAADPHRLPIDDAFVNPAHDGEYLAYALLARALRRSDAKGTQTGREGF